MALIKRVNTRLRYWSLVTYISYCPKMESLKESDEDTGDHACMMACPTEEVTLNYDPV